MTGQSEPAALEQMLGSARLDTYLKAASGDFSRATDLYLWANELSGALHSQLSFVEVAVRNALDPRIRDWNAVHGASADWTGEGLTAEPLYKIIRKPLVEARFHAAKEGRLREQGHPRRQAPVTHDEVIAQLMFGAWVTIIRPISGSSSAQKRLWLEATSRAFPNARQDDSGRHRLGQQLEVLRRLRNRVAHHDNLLSVNVLYRANGMLSVLNQIDSALPALASAKSALRRIEREDPRLAW